MALNIKNAETCNLARELAELTGETMTGAITVALRERLERQRDIQARLKAIRAISERVSSNLGPGPRLPRSATGSTTSTACRSERGGFGVW